MNSGAAYIGAKSERFKAGAKEKGGPVARTALPCCHLFWLSDRAPARVPAAVEAAARLRVRVPVPAQLQAAARAAVYMPPEVHAVHPS